MFPGLLLFPPLLPNSGRDNYHCMSLPFVEEGETSENLSQSIHTPVNKPRDVADKYFLFFFIFFSWAPPLPWAPPQLSPLSPQSVGPGCACTEEERGGCGIFDLHLLLPVPEKAVNPVTDAWVDVHVQ